MMWRAEGTAFDDLTRAIDTFDALFLDVAQQVMDQVASELGTVTTAAAEPVEPQEVPLEEPGEAAVSLDTLGLIFTLWATAATAELFPALTAEYLSGAFNLAKSIAPALSERAKRELPNAEPPTADNLLNTTIAEDYLRGARNRMVRFSDVLWEVARAQLLEGFMEGESINQLAARLRAVPEISAPRARNVARTEIVAASNLGSLGMVQVLGFSGWKIWEATFDNRTRETHRDADGQRVELSDWFLVGDSRLAFPGDPTGPPAEIISCRCSLHYSLTDEPLTAAGAAMAGEWVGVLTVEGLPTGDGRMFAPGVITSVQTPIPLLWQPVTADGHDGSVIVGNITAVSRQGNLILGRGNFDLEGTYGLEAYRMVRDGFLYGVSIDADNFAPSDVEYVYGPGVQGEGLDGPAVVLTIFHAGRLRGATLCAIPAFPEARISLMSNELESVDESMMIAAAEGSSEGGDTSRDETPELLTAAAYVLTIPDVPDPAWFEEPTDVDMAGALTVTDEGRVFGWLAPAGVEHRSFAHKVTVPMGNVDYSLFMGRETLVAGGGRVVSGALTMDCGHAATGLRDPGAALDHYDNSCSIVATVAIGENAGGVWVAGALVPGVTAEQIVKMMACQLSGDWRPHRDKRGWREFAGALLVPVPGFAMTRTEASASVRFEEGALVASAVPVRFQSARDATDSDCGCTLTPPAPKPRPANFASAARIVAESLGLAKADRLERLRSMVNETRR